MKTNGNLVSKLVDRRQSEHFTINWKKSIFLSKLNIFCIFFSNQTSLFYFQEIAALLISFDKHSEWQSKEVRTRWVLIESIFICNQNWCLSITHNNVELMCAVGFVTLSSGGHRCTQHLKWQTDLSFIETKSDSTCLWPRHITSFSYRL